MSVHVVMHGKPLCTMKNPPWKRAREEMPPEEQAKVNCYECHAGLAPVTPESSTEKGNSETTLDKMFGMGIFLGS